MADMIDRQAAIRTIEWWFGILDQNPDILIDSIITLPSVQPERWDTCFSCPLSHGCPVIKGCTNDQAEQYAGEIPADCPLDKESAQPEQKKGDWEYIERREPRWDIHGVKTWGVAYRCSKCGFIHTVIEDFGIYKYCPICGSDMRGETDES